MRLIDADELRKEINKQAYPHSDSTANSIYFSVLHLLTDAPTIEAVKVIRCEDCDNYTPTESGKLGYCCVNDNIWFANDFCKHGRPRGEEYANKI